MKQLFIFLAVLATALAHAQKADVRSAFLEKWENSKNYVLAIAEAMPDEGYSFKPTERQMTFEEQLQHIRNNIEWLTDTYLSDAPTDVQITNSLKESIIVNLGLAFDRTARAVEAMPDEDLAETVKFFAGPKSKLQILNLLQDHVTHHRGQLIVYLNLKEVEPPRYTGW
jgi:uncharacterized damage-inducible protein DinB